MAEFNQPSQVLYDKYYAWATKEGRKPLASNVFSRSIIRFFDNLRTDRRYFETDCGTTRLNYIRYKEGYAPSVSGAPGLVAIEIDPSLVRRPEPEPEPEPSEVPGPPPAQERAVPSEQDEFIADPLE